MKIHAKSGMLAAAVLLVACQSTGVIPLDGNTFMVAKKDGSPGLGVSFSTKAAVYQEATAFCKVKGLEVKTIRVDTTPARVAQLGGTELQFACVGAQQAAQG